MGQALGLALAGLRARAGASVAVLLVLVVALGGAVVGPVFLRAADESAVRRAVTGGPPLTRLIVVESGDASLDPPAVVRAARQALLADPVLRRVVGPGVSGGQTTAASGQGDVVPIVWRDDLCGHLVLRSGRCPTAAGEVVMADPVPPPEGWRLGGRAELTPGGAVTVVGTYAPIDVTEEYWGGRGYDPADSAGDPVSSPRRLGAAFTVPATLAAFVSGGGRERDVLDVPVLPSRITAANAGSVRTAVANLLDRIAAQVPDGAATTQLPDVLAQAAGEHERLRVPVLLVVGQLLLLSLLVLGLVVDGTSTARAPEVALAKLRGLGPWRVAAFGLLEVVLLVLAALPLSLGAGLLAARLALAGRLSPGTPVVLTAAAVWCALGAVAAALLTAAWAGRAALRTPAAELLRTTAPRRPRGGAAVPVAVAVLAAAGAAELGLGGGLRSDRLDVVSLATPGALALAVALLGAGLLPLACRALVPPTRGRGPVALFLAVRQLARRPAGGRSVVVVATALGLAAFAVFATSVQDENRHDRALADNGADTVYAVRPDPGVDLQRAVRTADPSGHAMAALLFDSPDSGPGERRLLAVDTSRLAVVSFWRADLAAGRTPVDLARALAPPTGEPVLLQGDTVEVDVDVQDLTPVPGTDPSVDPPPADPPSLRLELDGAGGFRQQLDLGPVPLGARTVQLPVTGCALEPCRLRALRVTRQLGDAPVTVALTLQRLAVRRAGVWSDDAATRAPGRWRTEGSVGSPPTAGPGGLAVTLTGAEGADPALVVADTPPVLPAVVTATRFRPNGRLQVPGLDAHERPAAEVALADLVPGAGADAALVDLTGADRAAAGTRSGAVAASVWAAPGTPAGLPDRLRAAGVQVTGVHTAAQRAAVFAAQGPALAVRLLLLAGGIATVLAAAGATLSLALLGRRRRYELAALRSAGLGTRSLSLSVLLEQVALLGGGAVLGLSAGLAGGALAIRSLPQFDDVDPGLPLLTSPSAGAVALVLGGAVLVVLVAAVLSGLALLRGRGVERLREAQG